MTWLRAVDVLSIQRAKLWSRRRTFLLSWWQVKFKVWLDRCKFSNLNLRLKTAARQIQARRDALQLAWSLEPFQLFHSKAKPVFTEQIVTYQSTKMSSDEDITILDVVPKSASSKGKGKGKEVEGPTEYEDENLPWYDCTVSHFLQSLYTSIGWKSIVL